VTVMSKNAPQAIIGPGANSELSNGQVGPIVHAEDAVTREDHGLRAADAFLGWLKYEVYVPAKSRVSAR
jgi:hypothetical protein